ncbi:MAG: hypothetical protein ACYDEF_07350 [Methanosarcina sp.]
MESKLIFQNHEYAKYRKKNRLRKKKKKRINPRQTIFQLHLNGMDKNKDNKE